MVLTYAHVFPGLLTPVLTQLFFPKLLTTFLTCFSRGQRRKYAGNKVRLNQGSNVNSTNQASNVCRRTTSRSDNNNPRKNVNNNMTMQKKSPTCIGLSKMEYTKCIVCNAREKTLCCLKTLNQYNVILQFFNIISIENCPKVWTLEIFIDVTTVCHLFCSRLTYDHS